MHGLQLLWPDDACALPGAHAKQTDKPVTLAKEPTSQPTQEDCEARPVYWPFGHAVQFHAPRLFSCTL